VSPGRRGETARADAEKLLARLRAAGPEFPADGLGDASMLPTEQPLDALREVSRSFGEDFAQEVATIEPGQWKLLGKKAKAMLVFPRILMAGLIVGGQGGDGALRKDGKTVRYY